MFGAVVCMTRQPAQDFEKGAIKYFRKSVKYYEGIAKRLVDNGQCLDVFACALDQVGLAEMQPAVQQTGGLMVLAEEFVHDLFTEALMRLFARDQVGALTMAFGGSMEVFCSRVRCPVYADALCTLMPCIS